jgi:hypothetical protein
MLISDPNSTKKAQEALSLYEWDCIEPIIVLHLGDIISALRKYIEGGITEVDIENWANTIECREDIEYEEIHKDIISELIHELANPTLTTRLTVPRAKHLISY